MSPLERILSWFDSQGDDIKTMVAFNVLSMFPDEVTRHEFLDELPEVEDRFRAHFQPLVDGPLTNAGAALMLRAQIEFTFLNKKDPRAWDRVDEALRRVQADVAAGDAPPEHADEIQRMREQNVLRARRYQREAEAWSELHDGPLSLSAIDEWLKFALVEATKESVDD